jgi:hypothetical protein
MHDGELEECQPRIKREPASACVSYLAGGAAPERGNDLGRHADSSKGNQEGAEDSVGCSGGVPFGKRGMEFLSTVYQ